MVQTRLRRSCLPWTYVYQELAWDQADEQIDDELVRRVLINSHRIEKEFFTKDREDANNEIKNRLVPTFGQATVHCSDGMTLRGE